MDTVSKQPISVKFMHISIADDIKKRFHAACAIRGLKMSQVITMLVEQWLKTNDFSVSSVKEGKLVTKSNAPSDGVTSASN